LIDFLPVTLFRLISFTMWRAPLLKDSYSYSIVPTVYGSLIDSENAKCGLNIEKSGYAVRGQ